MKAEGERPKPDKQQAGTTHKKQAAIPIKSKTKTPKIPSGKLKRSNKATKPRQQERREQS